MIVEVEIKEDHEEFAELMDLEEILNGQIQKYQQIVSYGNNPVERLCKGSIEELRDVSDYPKKRKVTVEDEEDEE